MQTKRSENVRSALFRIFRFFMGFAMKKSQLKKMCLILAVLGFVLVGIFFYKSQHQKTRLDEASFNVIEANPGSGLQLNALLESNNSIDECDEEFESIEKGLNALDKIGFWTSKNSQPRLVWSEERKRYVIGDDAYALYDRNTLEKMSKSGDGKASILIGLDVLHNEVYLWKGLGKERVRIVDATAFSDGVEHLQRAASLGEHGAYGLLGYAHYRRSLEFRTEFKKTGKTDAMEQERRHRLESVSWYILAIEHDVAPQRLHALAELKFTVRPSTEEMAAAHLLAAAESAKSSGYHVDISPAENAEIYKALEFDVDDIRAYMDCSKSVGSPSRSN